jgi:hypothetical protein
MGIFSLIDSIKRGRATLRGWGEYNRETGKWPLVSIAAHLCNFIVVAAGAIWLILYGERHDWSKFRFRWTALFIVAPYVIVWSWIEGKIKLNDMRNQRRISKSRRHK